MSNEKPVELTEAEALFNILFGHQRIPTYDGTAGQRCTGCDSLNGETDGPNSPRQAKHLAALILEAGWVSPEESEAREAAARREALLEAAEKHRVEVERLTDAFTDAARVGHDNAKAYLTERRRITRVEALADCPPGDCEGHPCIWPEDIRAALAEPERDEEGR